MEKLSKFSIYILFVFSFFACKQISEKETGVAAPSSWVTAKPIADTSNTKLTTSEKVTPTLKPKEDINIDYDSKQWVEILAEDSMLMLDIRYATKNNFTSKQIYDCARCFLRPEVATQLNKFRARILEEYNLGIILYDCYRPRPYQQKLWDIVPDPRFVGDPAKGSMHNRGMAIDVGLIDMKGNILEMGSDFDHFGQESFHSATNISQEAIKNRKLLKDEMANFGFLPITSEWWHYSYRENIQGLSDWVWECVGD